MQRLHHKRILINLLCMALALLVYALLVPALAHAEPGTSATYGAGPAPKFLTLANYSNSPQIQSVFASGSLSDYINVVFKTLISLGAIAAVLRITWAGYMYMGSADMWGNKQKAKEIASDAIIGLLLLLSIFLILNVINPNLVSLNVLKDFKKAPTTSATSPQTNQLPAGVTTATVGNNSVDLGINNGYLTQEQQAQSGSGTGIPN